MAEKLTHRGACHCKDVQFEFRAVENVSVTECNCSLCHMTGYKHIFVAKEDLTFLSGQDHLALYTFGTHTAQHYFCRTCGVKPLYRPRSHPEAWSVNLRCVVSDSLDVGERISFDGQNWEENIEALKCQT
jgi:hypothetical protein